MLYKLNPQHQFRFSVGQGFKAPDFRQLFLDFTNAAAGSYSVFGSAQAQASDCKTRCTWTNWKFISQLLFIKST